MFNAGKFWLLVGALLGAVVVAGGWFLIASPLMSQASTLDAQRQEIDNVNAIHEATLMKMRALEDAKEDNIALLAELGSSVPTTAKLEDYYDWVAVAANAAGVVLSKVEASPSQAFSAPNGAGMAEFGSSLQANLRLISVSMNVGGNAEQMNAFFEMLQRDGRLQVLTSMTMQLGSTLTGSASGYIFVVSDPSMPDLSQYEVPAPADAPADGENEEEPSA